jgi:hypothetical protein
MFARRRMFEEFRASPPRFEQSNVVPIPPRPEGYVSRWLPTRLNQRPPDPPDYWPSWLVRRD